MDERSCSIQVNNWIRHRASSAGRAQLPAGPPCPLPGTRGKRHNDPGQPQARGYYRAPHPFSRILWMCCCKPLFCIIFRCLQINPRTPFGTKSAHTLTPQKGNNDEKHAPGRRDIKVCQNKQKRHPQTLESMLLHRMYFENHCWNNPDKSPKNTPLNSAEFGTILFK